MTIPLTGAGGLFTRLGPIGTLCDAIDTWSKTTVPTDLAAIIAQQASTTESYYDGINTPLVNYQSNGSTFMTGLQGIAAATMVQMAYADTNIPTLTLSDAIALLIAQMKAASQTVQKAVVSSSLSATSGNYNDGNLVTSVKRADGLLAEDAFAEPIQISVSADAVTGGATLGQESILYRGGSAQGNTLSWLWPSGSGATASVTAVDGSGSNNNLLNGGFETFTVANTPDSWTIQTGTPGTTIFKSTGTVYKGSSSLQITGNGSELTAIAQIPSNFTGLSQFAVSFWLALSSNPAAGQLRVALVDGGGTVINDAQGTANSMTVNLTTAATSFTAYSASFRTPAPLPAGATLQFKLTTAMSNAVSLFLDNVGFTPMTVFYAGGPSVAAFSGAKQFVSLDAWTLTISNDYAGAGSWQKLFNRLMGMTSLGLLLPTSNAPTIAHY